MKRGVEDRIKTDLDQKMVLLSGPRQVGKTTLAKALYPGNSEYFNMDSVEHRLLIQKQAWRRDCDLVIFDELHKVRRWKNWIKGIYDTEGVRPRLLVTGSSRLDVYRRGGIHWRADFIPTVYIPFPWLRSKKSIRLMRLLNIS